MVQEQRRVNETGQRAPRQTHTDDKHGQLSFDQGAKAIQNRKHSPLNERCWNNWILQGCGLWEGKQKLRFFLKSLEHNQLISFAKLFEFNQVSFVYFYFHYRRTLLLKSIVAIYAKECYFCVSSKRFIASSSTCGPLIHFEFIFVYGVNQKQKYRSMEQERKPKDKLTSLWSINLKHRWHLKTIQWHTCHATISYCSPPALSLSQHQSLFQ